MAKAHQPTEITRECVRGLALMGKPAVDIGKVIGVSKAALWKHYKKELQEGGQMATALVAGQLFNLTQQNDDLKVKTTSCIFWMKTRAGWSDKTTIDHTSADGSMSPVTAVVVQGVEPKNKPAQ